MPWLFWLAVALSLRGGWNGWQHERRVWDPPGIAVADGPRIEPDASRAPRQDAAGFRYVAVGRLEGRAMVLGRRNYEFGEFAALVDATAPSGIRYDSSTMLGDRNCEIAWVDELELE